MKQTVPPHLTPALRRNLQSTNSHTAAWASVCDTALPTDCEVFASKTELVTQHPPQSPVTDETALEQVKIAPPPALLNFALSALEVSVEALASNEHPVAEKRPDFCVSTAPPNLAELPVNEQFSAEKTENSSTWTAPPYCGAELPSNVQPVAATDEALPL